MEPDACGMDVCALLCYVHTQPGKQVLTSPTALAAAHVPAWQEPLPPGLAVQIPAISSSSSSSLAAPPARHKHPPAPLNWLPGKPLQVVGSPFWHQFFRTKPLDFLSVSLEPPDVETPGESWDAEPNMCWSWQCWWSSLSLPKRK